MQKNKESASPSAGEGSAAQLGDNHVAIAGVKRAKSFSPNPIDVRVGDTVTWTNDHHEEHTVTSQASEFDSGQIGPSQSFSHTFHKTGTFVYYCMIHSSMVGEVIVG